MLPSADNPVATDGSSHFVANHRRMHIWFPGVVAVWSFGIAAGFAHLLDYATTPGSPRPTVANWPNGLEVSFDRSKANLVLLAHPQCPCTNATIDEFERLIARTQGLVAATVAFYRPANAPEQWVKTDLWRRVAAMPNVKIQFDVDGRIAKNFGANTSGHLLLYHRDGRRLFSGGITNARGHAGSSFGADALRSLLETGRSDLTETPVYGCPIETPLSPNLQSEKPCCNK